MIVYLFILTMILLWQFILFLILAMPLRLFNLRNSQFKFKEEGKNSYIENEKQKKEVKKHSLIKRIKNQIFFILTGYERLLMYKIGYFPSHRVRNFVYKYIFLVQKDDTSIIYYGAYIRGGHNLKIGKGCIIGDKCMLDARQGIYIGNNVNIGTCVSLWTDSHDMNDPYFRSTQNKKGPISIGDRAWLGSHCVILDNVNIGEGAVVAAGSVVTKNVPSYTVVGGIPAKKIGERTHNLRYELGGKLHQHFY